MFNVKVVNNGMSSPSTGQGFHERYDDSENICGQTYVLDSLRETAKILSNLVNKVKLKYLTCWQQSYAFQNIKVTNTTFALLSKVRYLLKDIVTLELFNFLMIYCGQFFENANFFVKQHHQQIIMFIRSREISTKCSFLRLKIGTCETQSN